MKRPQVPWTNKDVDKLKAMAPTHSATEIGAAMGRDRGSVTWHARRHKIRLAGGKKHKFVPKRYRSAPALT